MHTAIAMVSLGAASCTPPWLAPAAPFRLIVRLMSKRIVDRSRLVATASVFDLAELAKCRPDRPNDPPARFPHALWVITLLN